MTPLYTKSEFDTSTSKDKLQCQCEGCGSSFYTTKREIKRSFKNRPTTASFCSKKCVMNRLNTDRKKNCKQLVTCFQCHKNFLKYPGQIKKSNKHFCSLSCHGTYFNINKTFGISRSKLEKWIETQLTNKYPDLKIDYNRRDVINTELDIFIPELKLAFELNGIFHYEPVFGDQKLSTIQNKDKNKFEICQQHQISLCIIDVSKQKYFKEKTSFQYLDIITNIIDALLKR